jgi:hypothetical protein
VAGQREHIIGAVTMANSSEKKVIVPVRIKKSIRTRQVGKRTARAKRLQVQTPEIGGFAYARLFKGAMIGGLVLVVMLATSGLTILASAFEASVVNVTAKIERPPSQCGALSIGYWGNHEGCAKGLGSSNWTNLVNDISLLYSGVFTSYSGANICQNLWIPNCPSGNSTASKLCKAKAHTLANELNIASGRLQYNALLAGADDGSTAFDNLGLSSSSTINEALLAIEAILADPTSTKAEITDADYVAERIYAFYEDENPIFPQCIYELPDEEPQQQAVSGGGGEAQTLPEEPVEEEPQIIEEDKEEKEEKGEKGDKEDPVEEEEEPDIVLIEDTSLVPIVSPVTEETPEEEPVEEEPPAEEELEPEEPEPEPEPETEPEPEIVE